MRRIINDLSVISNNYDTYIIDLWGVTHDGSKLFPEVLDCYRHLKESGATVVILSNAPRRVHASSEKISSMGLDASYYDILLTSGEVVHSHLKLRENEWYKTLGQKAFHIGATKDYSLFEEDACERVESIMDAEFILNTGIAKAGESLEDYKQIMDSLYERKLPMLCANPDKVVPIGDKIEICAGTIADYYESIGGEVKRVGKPFPCVYEHLKNAGYIKGRVLAIGDSMETDIKGAVDHGFDSALIGSGVHRDELGAVYGKIPEEYRLNKLFDAYNYKPTYVIPGLIYHDTKGSHSGQ